MLFCINNLELWVPNEKMKGIIKAILHFFSPINSPEDVSRNLQQRKVKRQPVQLPRTLSHDTIHATCGHYSSTSTFKVAQEGQPDISLSTCTWISTSNISVKVLGSHSGTVHQLKMSLEG